MSSRGELETSSTQNGKKRARSEDVPNGPNTKRSKTDNQPTLAPHVALGETSNAGSTKKKRKKKQKKRKSAVSSELLVPTAMVASGSSIKIEDLPKHTKDKGKIVTESPDAQITRLTRELAAQAKVVEKHQNILGQVQSNLTCKICLDIMFKPYVLAPCGHTACHPCLVQWFTAPPAADHEPHPPVLLRKKTCPHCRASIKERPTECYDIKNAVAVIVKSELVPGLADEPLAFTNAAPALIVVPLANPAPNNGQPVDPWVGIFRKPSNHLHEYDDHQFLDFGFEMPLEMNPPNAQALMGVQDMQDGGVYRCIDCLHEILDGACSDCGRVYPGHGGEYDSSDEDSGEDGIDLGEDPGWMGLQPAGLLEFFGEIHDEDDDEDDESEEAVEATRLRRQLVQMVRQEQRHAQLVTNNEDESESDSEDEDDEMEGSFIDDDDVEVVENPRIHARVPSLVSVSSDSEDENEGPRMIGFHSEGSEDSEDSATAPRKRAPAAALRRAAAVPIVVDDSSSSEEDEEDEVEVIAVNPAPRSRARAMVIESDDEDEVEVEDAASPQNSAVKQSTNAELVEVDDEEDSDGSEDSETAREYAERLAAEERDMYGDDGSTSRAPQAFRDFIGARRAPPPENLEEVFADEDVEDQEPDSDDGEDVMSVDVGRTPWIESDDEDEL